MSVYQTFTVVRITEPDRASLLAQLRALDATAGIQHESGPSYVVKKATAWTGPQVTAVQNILETAPVSSPQLSAQAVIDSLGLVEKAIVLALLDQLNVIRSKLSPPLGAITPTQALIAVRDKAGQIS